MKDLKSKIISIFKNSIFRAVSKALLYIIFGMFFYYASRSFYVNAYVKSYMKGYNSALDTVNAVLYKQLRSDTTHCTKIVICDTSVYFLLHKNICK